MLYLIGVAICVLSVLFAKGYLFWLLFIAGFIIGTIGAAQTLNSIPSLNNSTDESKANEDK